MIKRLLEKWFGLEPAHCESCDNLKLQNEAQRLDNSRLVQALIEATKPVQPIIQQLPEVNEKELRPKHLPWRMRQQMLEQEDRRRAQIIREFNEAKSVADLEKQVGIDATRPAEAETTDKPVETAS